MYGQNDRQIDRNARDMDGVRYRYVGQYVEIQTYRQLGKQMDRMKVTQINWDLETQTDTYSYMV